ncbi:hypothetical protein WG66_016562 [Moniliophthora roreri]|nr:hypothetical protein WG66_016562 [Moniliophthora roreri]
MLGTPGSDSGLTISRQSPVGTSATSHRFQVSRGHAMGAERCLKHATNGNLALVSKDPACCFQSPG